MGDLKLESKNADLESRNADLLSDNFKLVIKLAKLESEKTDLLSEMNKLQSELASIRKLLPLNHWNGANCHPDLFIDDCRTSLVVEHRGKAEGFHWASVRAEFIMLRHCQAIFYFEVTIVKRALGWLLVGLAPLSLKTTAHADLKELSGCYFYNNCNGFFGHHVEGCKYFYDDDTVPYVDGKPDFGTGAVIGCGGVNLATNQIIYTKNRKRLDTSNLFVSESAGLYPFVAMEWTGDKVEANFGQRAFAYDLSKEPAMGNHQRPLRSNGY